MCGNNLRRRFLWHLRFSSMLPVDADWPWPPPPPQMRVLCVLLVALSLALADGGGLRSDRTFGSFFGLKPKPGRPQTLVIVQPGQVQIGRPVYPGPPVYSRPPVNTGSGGTGPDGLLYSWKVRGLEGARFTWGQADKECRDRGYRLVTIESARKNEYISRKLARDGKSWTWGSGCGTAGMHMHSTSIMVCLHGAWRLLSHFHLSTRLPWRVALFVAFLLRFYSRSFLHTFRSNM